jgi:DNA-binding response OmpR family regulator
MDDKKILIVEDDTATANLLAGRLGHAGFQTQVAPDAVVAARECMRWKPDLVLLDLKVPAGGGVAVLSALRRSIYTQNVPVIVLTGADSSLLKQVIALGIQEFIQKPFDSDQLVAQIKQLLGLPPEASASPPQGT